MVPDDIAYRAGIAKVQEIEFRPPGWPVLSKDKKDDDMRIAK